MLDRDSFVQNEKSSGEQYTPLRYKRERQKLVVRTKKGEVILGMCFALNKNAPGFHLDLLDRNGASLNRTSHILFDDLKAVFYVKSFDGKFNPADYASSSRPESKPVAIVFEDEEVFFGCPLHAHWEEDPRFYVVPEDRESNNLMVLVERSAVKAIHDMHGYQKRLKHEFNVFVRDHAKPGESENECTGDYHFSKHDYKTALRYYRMVREQEPENERIRKKLCATKYNLGIRHIKQKDYARALRLMELVLALDPHHDQARRKAEKLKEHLRNKTPPPAFRTD